MSNHTWSSFLYITFKHASNLCFLIHIFFSLPPSSPLCLHLMVTAAAAAAAKSLQLCPTLCDPIDGSPTGSPIPGILQASTLEWVAISFSNAWKWSRSVVSDSQRPHGLQPTRLLRPWDYPGKSTGVGCLRQSEKKKICRNYLPQGWALIRLFQNHYLTHYYMRSRNRFSRQKAHISDHFLLLFIVDREFFSFFLNSNLLIFC